MRGKSGYRSIKCAAEELGVSQATIRRGITAGHIPAVHVHGNWRIPGSYFDDLEQQAYAKVVIPLTGSAILSAPAEGRGRVKSRRPVSWSSVPIESSVRIVRAVPS